MLQCSTMIDDTVVSINSPKVKLSLKTTENINFIAYKDVTAQT